MIAIPILVIIIFWTLGTLARIRSQQQMIEQQLKAMLPPKYHHLAERMARASLTSEVLECQTIIKFGLYNDHQEERMEILGLLKGKEKG